MINYEEIPYGDQRTYGERKRIQAEFRRQRLRNDQQGGKTYIFVCGKDEDQRYFRYQNDQSVTIELKNKKRGTGVTDADADARDM